MDLLTRGGGGFFVPAEGAMQVREKAQIMDGAAIHRVLTRVAHEIVEKNKGTAELVLVGLRSRGVDLARRRRGRGGDGGPEGPRAPPDDPARGARGPRTPRAADPGRLRRQKCPDGQDRAGPGDDPGGGRGGRRGHY